MKTKKYIALTVSALALSAMAASPLATPVMADSAHPEFATAQVANVDYAAMGMPIRVGMRPYVEAEVLDIDPARIDAAAGEGSTFIIRQTYAQRNYKPVWKKSAAREFIDLLETSPMADSAEGEGFITRARFIANQRFTHKDGDVRAKADIELSAMWLQWSGQQSSTSLLAQNADTKTESLVLAGLGKADRALSLVEPDHPQYHALKTGYERYRNLAENGGWSAIPNGEMMEPGDIDPRVPLLRDRLEAESYIVPEVNFGLPLMSAQDSQNYYDMGLEMAVHAFQKNHGLEQDGLIGGRTLSALNESAEDKANRILATLDEWRELGDPGEKYIWANIPSYTAEAWKDGQRDITMKTIVGKPRYATQVFSDEVEWFETNPKWYVPASIMARQKVHKFAKDPSYGSRMGYTVIDKSTGGAVNAANVDWSSPTVTRDYRLVQSAGRLNALGELKIIFPNPDAIYFHGTDQDYLFEKSARAFSSGCVRLEDPVAMAKWIAAGDSEIELAQIDETLESKTTKRFHVSKPTQVHLTYMTVTADETGQMVFHADVYNRNQKPAELTYATLDLVPELTSEGFGGATMGLPN